jgi:hypothetical protein
MAEFLGFGSARLEYGQMFKVLTPEQRREVHQKMLAHRAAEMAGQK